MAKKIEEIIEGKNTPEKPEPKADPPKEEKPEVKTEAPQEPIETDQAPPEDGGVSDSGPDPVRKAAGFQAAYTAEKKKRQESEQMLEQLRKESAERDQWYRQQSEQWTRTAQQFAPKLPEIPKINLFDDPDRWQQQEVLQPIQTVENKLRFEFSEKLAKKTYGAEYGEAEKWAEAQIRQNQATPIRHLLANSDDPGETLVQEFRKNKFAADMADPAALFQKMFDERLNDPQQKKAILERLGAELKPAQPSLAPSQLPTPLERSRSVGGAKGPAWQGPRPLNEIVPRGGAKST